MSKGTQLSKIEQDALRYRVLQRFMRKQDINAVTLASPPAAYTITDVTDLNEYCDQWATVEDVADLLIEATQPSLSPLHSAESLEEHCVTATREIAESIRRGIYQPMLPTDVDVLRTCAKLAEQMQQNAPAVRQATHLLETNVAILKQVHQNHTNTMIHFMLALLASPDHSIRIPISLVVPFKIEDYVLEATDDIDGSATTFTLKRKQEHQR
jgi:hypothetical protein